MPHPANKPAAARVAPPNSSSDDSFKVVIVGGGVAGIEAALCLNDLAGDRVRTTMVAPNHDFVYLPSAVEAPFEHSIARRYPLARIAEDAGAQLCSDALAWLDSDFSVVHTKGGEQLDYDALLLAPGASMYRNYRHALTLDPYRIDEQMRRLDQDVADSGVQTLAYVIPDGPVWPLPIYELALITAARVREISAQVELTIVTPEAAPLAAFGEVIADYVAGLLERANITMVLSTNSAVQGPQLIALHPAHGRHADPMRPRRQMRADRVIALPQLFGPHCPGVPTSARRGFITTDRQQLVEGIGSVYAAGDATDFPVKFGGIAAQQADVAAQSIAALAGAAVEPVKFEPQLHALLLTGAEPVMLDAHPSGSTATNSRVTQLDGAVARGKIDARYLAPYLQDQKRSAHQPSHARARG